MGTTLNLTDYEAQQIRHLIENEIGREYEADSADNTETLNEEYIAELEAILDKLE